MLSKQIAVTSFGFILLVLWYFSYHTSCFVVLLPIVLSLVLYRTNYEYSVAKKRCLVHCYFKENSFLYKIFTKKIIIFILSAVSSVVLSLVLLVNIVRFDIVDFIVLFLDMMFIIYLYNAFSRNQSLNENIKEPIVKKSVAVINSVALATLFLIINLYQTPPDYIQNDLIQTINLASNQLYAQCDIVDSVVRLTNEIVAFKWWILLNLTINSTLYFLNILVWTLYLLGNYLMIFAFSRLNLELLSMLKRGFKDEAN